MTVEQTEMEIVEQDLAYDESDAGPYHRTHIVNPPMNRHVPGWVPDWEAQDVVDAARGLGVEVVALCGLKFIPTRNPDKYDACTQCFKVAEMIMSGLNE